MKSPTTAEPLDYERARQLLDAAVAAAGPDFIYEPPAGHRQPRYVDDSSGELRPSCLVGHVLHAAGWTLDELTTVEGQIPSQLGSPWNRLTIAARNLLGEVQSKQDIGYTWGYAVVTAVDIHDEDPAAFHAHLRDQPSDEDPL